VDHHRNKPDEEDGSQSQQPTCPPAGGGTTSLKKKKIKGFAGCKGKKRKSRLGPEEKEKKAGRRKNGRGAGPVTGLDPENRCFRPARG